MEISPLQGEKVFRPPFRAWSQLLGKGIVAPSTDFEANLFLKPSGSVAFTPVVSTLLYIYIYSFSGAA
jgi:hypothetical protein